MAQKGNVHGSLSKQYQIRQATRGYIDTAQKLNGFNLFRYKHIILDKYVLGQRLVKEQEKENEKYIMVQNTINKYYEQKKAYDAVNELNLP